MADGADDPVSAVLRQVRRVEIVARRAVNDLLAGQYHSAFRGRGMEFDEVREYQPGDEIRTIDWNVTARAGTPFIKRFKEERELTVMFLVDESGSTAFGSGVETRRRAQAKCAALLMFTALANQDKVGLATFADGPRRYFPPRKGRGAVLRLVRELFGAPEPAATSSDTSSITTSIGPTLDWLNRVQKRRCVSFLLSDFLDPALHSPAFARTLAATARRHDLIAVELRDPRERELPAAGLITFVDLETGARRTLDSASANVRDWWRRKQAAREAALAELLRRCGVDLLAVTLPDATAPIRPGRDALLDEFSAQLKALFRRRELRR
ncbi:MAG: DUF58 domain-containing protein [Planctomycetes bacterium]|nr:DUF58 domain-containing protein [Planctomycetota bacterium]